MTGGQMRADHFPPEIMRELQEQLLRIQPPAAASRLWQRMLTAEERQHLGGNLSQAYSSGATVGIWMRLRGVSQPRAIIDVAQELNFIDETTRNWLLRGIRELPESIEDAITSAVQSCELVLVEQSREVFWQGTKIDINWTRHRSWWNFLWVLCQQAQSGGGVDYMHLGDHKDPSYPAKIKSKLCCHEEFPRDLEDRIHPMAGKTQKLELPAEQIRMFATSNVEVVREVRG